MPPTTQLDELLLVWEERQRRGELCTPEDLCSDKPELLEPFRQRLADLQQMLSAVSQAGILTVDGDRTGSFIKTHPNGSPQREQGTPSPRPATRSSACSAVAAWASSIRPIRSRPSVLSL